MSKHAYSDIYDCAACGDALAYPTDDEGEALDGGDFVCLTCILSYVVDLRTGTLTRAPAHIERLTAERAALLAPVEGVDLEEVLTAAWWCPVCGSALEPVEVRHDETCTHCGTPVVAGDGHLLHIVAREVARLRDHLDTARRLLPSRYVAADGSILDPQRCTPHARDCAECGRGRAHDEECLGVLETPAEEVARLRAALEEARLTLAAEQGRAEGAPFSSSPRLRAAVNAERIRQGLSWRGLAARIGVSSSGFTRWNAGHELSVPAYLKVCDWLRSAMLAADAATEAR